MRLRLAFLTLIIPVIASAATAAPVVAELFESQGCSSCPPAERVMKQLHKTFGSEVLLLTCHVDYWDHLGWTDAYSYSPCTERQKNYARAFGQDTIYTPELVLQGEVGFIGSDLKQAVAEVTSRQSQPRAALIPRVTARAPQAITLEVRIPPELSPSVRQLTVIAYENAPAVQVLRGENTGATMSGDFAVRTIQEMPTPVQGLSVVTVPLKPDWNRDHLGYIVLARGDTSVILAAGIVPEMIGLLR